MEPNMVKNQLSLDECLKLLDSTSVCVLSLNGPDGWPYSVPVNFVRIGDKLYYHGRRTGTRVRCMEGDDRCTLVAYSEDGYEDYGENACDTTTLFGSVVVRGRVKTVESDDLKLTVLKAMLEKVTPEKKDFPINAEIVSRTGMFEISIEEITGKHREARPGSRTMPA